jgi:hypothetical protein
VTGQNLGANAPVFIVYGLSNTQSAFGNLPFGLPGTNCSLLASIDASALAFASTTGTLGTGAAANALVVPADPVYSGLVVHEQLVPFAPAANVYGVAFSNAQSVTLGTLTAPGRGTYAVWHGQDASATVATDVKAFGYAVRLGTL